MQDKVNLKIDWASYEASKYACENWHYSKTIPVGKLVKVGAWENDKFIGVVIFGRGANNNMLKPFGLNADEGCELVRIALKRHETYVSKILAFAIKFLKKQSPELRLIVSYSDADQNHHGGIYQATNWIYNGKTAETVSYVDKDGRSWHARNVGPRVDHDKQISAVRSQCRVVKNPGKHRYLMPLDDNMRKQVQQLAKPYPKRMKQAMIDTIDTAKVQHLSIRSTELSEL